MGRKPTNQIAKWSYEAHKIMLQLIKEKSEFNADDFFRAARQIEMPANLIGKFSGNLFRTFSAAGYITKTNLCRVSERNNSSLIATWRRGVRRLEV